MTKASHLHRVHRKSKRWKDSIPYLTEQFAKLLVNGLVPVSEYTERTNENYRESYVLESLDALACSHLGIEGVENTEIVLQIGCDAAIALFFSRFWTTTDPRMAVCLDKLHWREREDLSIQLKWYVPFHCGLIQCMLANRWDDVTRLADWAEFDFVRDSFMGKGCKEEQVADVYLLVASSLRSKPPMPGVEKVVARIEGCRDKWPGLLLEVWRSIEARDQARFDETLAASLTQFTKDKNEESFAHWLALPETALVHMAMHFGMKMPEPLNGLEDYIITRQSLGLEP